MRDAQHPGGFSNLPSHREETVRLGNAFASISARLAEAQERAGNVWTLEQRATSLVWLYEPIANLLLKDGTYLVTVDVCMYGAPWKKPTGLAANFEAIEEVSRYCVHQTTPNFAWTRTGRQGLDSHCFSILAGFCIRMGRGVRLLSSMSR